MVIDTLPLYIQEQINRETLRLNIRTWKLHPWERRGKKGYLRLCGLNADGRAYLLARIPAPTLKVGEGLYLAINHFLAKRPDWLGIESSTSDKDGAIFTGEGVDWSKL